MPAPHLDDQAPDDLDDLDSPPPRRRSSASSLTISAVALGVALWVGYDQRADLAFWLSEAPRVDLGSPGAYQLDRAAPGVVARITGEPGGSADRFSRLWARFEIVAFKGTNVLVVRRLKPDPSGSNVEPPPDRRPFTAEGRLLADTDLPGYAHAYSFLVQRGDAQPANGKLFVLLDGELPRSGLKTPAMILGLALLVVLNLAALAKGLLRRA